MAEKRKSATSRKAKKPKGAKARLLGICVDYSANETRRVQAASQKTLFDHFVQRPASSQDAELEVDVNVTSDDERPAEHSNPRRGTPPPSSGT
jgi:hypothetical protein